MSGWNQVCYVRRVSCLVFRVFVRHLPNVPRSGSTSVSLRRDPSQEVGKSREAKCFLRALTPGSAPDSCFLPSDRLWLHVE